MVGTLVGRPPRAAIERRERIRHARGSGQVARRKTLLEYLEPNEVAALIEAAPHADAQLLMLVQWRAGLRIAEALAIEVADLHFDSEPGPVLAVRGGKGGKDRFVPMHSELRAGLRNHIRYRRLRRGRLVEVSRPKAWRWCKRALADAQAAGAIPVGREVATHAPATAPPGTGWPAGSLSTSSPGGWATPAFSRRWSTSRSCRTRSATWTGCPNRGAAARSARGPGRIDPAGRLRRPGILDRRGPGSGLHTRNAQGC